jgi:hypothetical protein
MPLRCFAQLRTPQGSSDMSKINSREAACDGPNTTTGRSARSSLATNLARQSGRLLTGKYASIGPLNGACINEQFAARSAPAHDPQPRVRFQVVPGCVEHSLHDLHASEDLNEELFGQDKRSNSVYDNRFETRFLLQHSRSVNALSKRSAPGIERQTGERAAQGCTGETGVTVCFSFKRYADNAFR